MGKLSGEYRKIGSNVEYIAFDTDQLEIRRDPLISFDRNFMSDFQYKGIEFPRRGDQHLVAEITTETFTS